MQTQKQLDVSLVLKKDKYQRLRNGNDPTRHLIRHLYQQKPHSRDINAADFRDIPKKLALWETCYGFFSHRVTRAITTAGEDLLSPRGSIVPHNVPRRRFAAAVPPVSLPELICLGDESTPCGPRHL